MEYPCAYFYTILSSHVNTTNIFQFLTIFEQHLNILPQICKFYTYSASHSWFYLQKVYELPLCKILHLCINKCGYDKYFQFLAIFTHNLIILPQICKF